MNISVLILTYNEEKNIESCLKSVAWSDDIVILDSYSDDNTEYLSKKHCVRFYQRKFDDYARQRNYGMKDIRYSNEWLLMIDADEIVSDELRQEMVKIVDDPLKEVSLFYMRRKDFFWGKWIKHSSGYPTWFGRLIRIGEVTVKRSINEEYQTNGNVCFLRNHLYHYPFNKGLDLWIEKHNKYSTLESSIHDMEKNKFINLFSSNPIKRRKCVKKIMYRMPGRPLIYFVIIYFFRRGFLDGSAGFHFCMLKTFYEYLICCKIKNNKISN